LSVIRTQSRAVHPYRRREAKQGSPEAATPKTEITYKMNIPKPGWRNWQTQRT
jgi:hypothetical protein